MGVKERRAREKSETRDKILDAARELFITEGYEGVSMRKVAEKIEYSPTAIYVHFADKEELFRAALSAGFRAARAKSSKARRCPPIRVERIRQIGAHLHRIRPQFPNHYKLMFMTPHPAHEPDEMDQRNDGQS